MTQNICSLKTSPIGCIDIWNVISLQKFPKKIRKVLVLDDVCLDISAPITLFPWESRTHVVLPQNCAGRTSKAPKLCGAKIDCKFALRSFRAIKVRPAELWSLWNVPRRVLEQLCALLSHGDIVTVAKIPTKNHLKLIYRSLRSFALCYPITSVKIYTLKYYIPFSQLTTINSRYLRYLSAIYIEIYPSLHW